MFQRKPRGSESVTSDPVEALNTDPQHRPFVIEVTTDPFTRIELRDKYNKPLGASRTNDKARIHCTYKTYTRRKCNSSSYRR